MKQKPFNEDFYGLPMCSTSPVMAPKIDSRKKTSALMMTSEECLFNILDTVKMQKT